MEKNKNIYYGILFYFLYLQIYGIISCLLILPILSMNLSIHLVLILPLLFVIILSIWFYKLDEQFPKIKGWFILLVVLFSMAVNFLNLPDRFLSFGDDSVYRNTDRAMIMSYITTCKAILLIAFITISYLKYLKAQKKL